jgi:N4-(beta-N-acetylglucosaminyl)-L-asparaginase
MTDRRDFITASLLPTLLAAGATGAGAQTRPSAKLALPCVISTWDFGVAANQAAWAVLSKGGRALDVRRWPNREGCNGRCSRASRRER